MQKNITKELNNSKVSLDHILKMAENGLDLFDPKCPFYNDICTHYPDILNKDVPLKKRALAYYPNIQLCDDNCELISVFLNNLTANCDCPISEEKQKDKIKNNAFYQYGLGQYEEFLYLTNINVIKCYKDIFKFKYFKKAYGGFIILGLILIKILCTILYFNKNKSELKNIFSALLITI